MTVWFEGESVLECGLEEVRTSLDDIGQLFVGVVSRMPGMTSVQLVEQGRDFVTIATNEGTMRRTNISSHAEDGRLALEFDEKYEAGSRVTTTSHFRHEFAERGQGVNHRLVMSDVEATGLLGFFYRSFGKSNTGEAFLSAYKAHLEERQGCT